MCIRDRDNSEPEFRALVGNLYRFKSENSISSENFCNKGDPG